MEQGSESSRSDPSESEKCSHGENKGTLRLSEPLVRRPLNSVPAASPAGCCLWPCPHPWLPPPPACWPRAPRQRLSAAPTRHRRSARRCALQLEAVYACFPRVSVALDGCRYGGGKQPESACKEVGQAGHHRCCSLMLPVCCCCLWFCCCRCHRRRCRRDARS
eukprot:COSAG01_NODE_10848_length_2068_cov_5.018283_1_plen_163_part_00